MDMVKLNMIMNSEVLYCLSGTAAHKIWKHIMLWQYLSIPLSFHLFVHLSEFFRLLFQHKDINLKHYMLNLSFITIGSLWITLQLNLGQIHFWNHGLLYQDKPLLLWPTVMPPCVQFVTVHYSCISWQCDTLNRTSRHSHQRPCTPASKSMCKSRYQRYSPIPIYVGFVRLTTA